MARVFGLPYASHARTQAMSRVSAAATQEPDPPEADREGEYGDEHPAWSSLDALAQAVDHKAPWSASGIARIAAQT